MMGGVAGHAGLFSNANDLAILMQMNLQNGYYGGRRYLLEPTIPTFTKTYNKGNRRGLGWDNPGPKGEARFLILPPGILSAIRVLQVLLPG
jgi:CubicO group peptidase (beta-lactamase class C family)